MFDVSRAVVATNRLLLIQYFMIIQVFFMVKDRVFMEASASFDIFLSLLTHVLRGGFQWIHFSLISIVISQHHLLIFQLYAYRD